MGKGDALADHVVRHRGLADVWVDGGVARSSGGRELAAVDGHLVVAGPYSDGPVSIFEPGALAW